MNTQLEFLYIETVVTLEIRICVYEHSGCSKGPQKTTMAVSYTLSAKPHEYSTYLGRYVESHSPSVEQ